LLLSPNLTGLADLSGLTCLHQRNIDTIKLSISSTVIDITSRRQACEEMVADDNHTWKLADFARALPLEKAQFAEFGSHEGISSGRQFFPERLKLPLQKLSTEGVQITSNGVAQVEEHLQRFSDDQPNALMIARLKRVLAGEIHSSPYDINFYTHELREFQHYKALGYEVGTPDDPDLASDLWNNAHTATLEEYGLTDVDLYHPETKGE